MKTKKITNIITSLFLSLSITLTIPASISAAVVNEDPIVYGNTTEAFYKTGKEISMMKDCIRRYLDELAEYDSSYLVCDNADAFPLRYLYNNDADEVTSLLFGLYDSESYLGYVIVRTSDFVILESSLGAIPYNFENSSSIKFIYDYGNYGIYDEVNDKAIYVTSNIDATQYSQFFTSNNLTVSGSSANYSMRSNLTNVPIFEQGDANCIVCATAHLLLYWNNHGYRGLTPTITSQEEFDSFTDTINEYFSSYANNLIPSAIIHYASTRRPGYGVPGLYFTTAPLNTWNPEYSDVVAEISNGRPVLLGFAAGAYHETYGHMTLCIGAATQVIENNYVAVVDGHSLNVATKLWDSTYNDFICSLIVGTR